MRWTWLAALAVIAFAAGFACAQAGAAQLPTANPLYVIRT
jgi:hypothetical protein